MKRSCFSFIFLLVAGILLSQNAVDNFINNPLLQNAGISLIVKDQNTGLTLYEYRSKNSAVPASTMKLVTTATALELFGPDFRFETKLEIDGQIGSDSTLQGNLYIRGGADPTLGSDKVGDKDFFPKWIEAIRKAGIKNIDGKVIADPGIFDRQVINPKWTWEDMGNYYAPGIHGISYLDNTFRGYFRTGKPGTVAEPLRTDPVIPGLKIDSYAKSANIGFDNSYFYGAPFANYRFLTGQLPANKAEFVVKGDIPEPALLLAQHLTEQLRKSGSLISGEAEVQYNVSTSAKIIYTHYSHPLSDIITETNVKSNNHFAEYLFRYIGTKNGIPATIDGSISVIRNFWKSKGLSVDQLFQCDGSGLSPTDAVSAGFFVELLQYMKGKSRNSDVFYNSLPVSGVNGTLSSLLEKTALQGKVHAKSGTIERVKCYAGYIDAPSGPLVFALMVNNPYGTSKQVVKKMEDFLLEIAK
jgi:D-alanyl-D-alanine carboxypeptidase/D-alanyl-D-alanine-endopeptidase (penicillin-binding protein 4)